MMCMSRLRQGEKRDVPYESFRADAWVPVPDGTGYDIRPDILEAVQLHVAYGQPCGHFLSAVLCDHLKDAVRRADEHNVTRIRDLVKLLFNRAPAECWGSKEKVAAWRSVGGMDGFLRNPSRYDRLLEDHLRRHFDRFLADHGEISVERK